MAGQQSSAFSILFVCTGNICRSALAERLGRAYLDSVLGSDATNIQLSSAGTRAVVGSAMHPDSALVLEGLGGDPAGHVARQLDERIAAAADLTLAMTRQHRRDVLALAPRALSRTFTLLEAADLARSLGDRASESGGEVGERARIFVAELAAARSRRGDNGADDIADPIGRPLEVHEEMGEAIAAALLRLLARIADVARA